MVDAVVSTFVSTTIEKLSEFVIQHVNIRIGVKDGIVWLKEELGYLLISVRAAEAHQDKEQIRLWTDSVRDVANQAVLLLERFGAQQKEHAAAEQGGVLDRMRSFICICKKEANLFEVEQLTLMFSRFNYLKVLNLTRVSTSERIPKEIGDLVLLKFLGVMRCTSSKEALVIPPSVVNLKRLQTLCGPPISHSPSDYVFPKEICELKELRHLKFHNNFRNLNISRDQTKLRTIEKIVYKEWFHIDTINLTNLRTLCIHKGEGEEEEEYSLGSIANLTSLQQLSLSSYGGNVSTLQPLSSCKHLKKVGQN